MIATGIKEAGYAAGEYIEEIGKTDLKEFTQEQWLTLIEVIIRNYNVNQQLTGEDIPLW